MSEFQTAFVRGLRYEAKNIISIELAPTVGTQFQSFEAGSHIDLHLPNGLVRSYSLLNSPEEKDCYVLGVLLDGNSKGGSTYIHKELRVGQELQISKPRNNFTLDEAANHSVLVAGGIGITPIYCMLVRLLTLGNSVELIYCARSRQEAAYLDQLEKLNVKITWHFDDEKAGIPNLEQYLAGHDKDVHFYCCGPVAMLEAFEAACQKLGYDNSHVEYFAAKEIVEAEQSHAYVVELAKSGMILDVPAGGSLIEVLETAGVLVNTACRQGICGACETKVLEGMPDHRDSVLSPRQKAANDVMMVCVSGCKSDKLILDL
ncbi:PDR/VanB family oxidoreductase [Entomomonas sp. E2T0]|uniref:PDR/VanB family oxidoreductase n=1 Tax=Entomomonas sp. E2T0 TaxID=2930213 RepID=UPI0022282CBF|nr:PDR/VanB family oxidoreductase [Entomomonas sp. E2T0]UYZ82659.1 PDR/VanB family oxidoreductase [Entomomonas sp. E2T0]